MPSLLPFFPLFPSPIVLPDWLIVHRNYLHPPPPPAGQGSFVLFVLLVLIELPFYLFLQLFCVIYSVLILWHLNHRHNLRQLLYIIPLNGRVHFLLVLPFLVRPVLVPVFVPVLVPVIVPVYVPFVVTLLLIQV